MNSFNTKYELVRIGGKLKEIVTTHDDKGTLLHKSIKTAKVEFYVHDFVQVIIGSMLLAIPVGFTQEVWELGAGLLWWKVLIISALSIFFISIFHYYNFYRNHFAKHQGEFWKRVVVTYLVALFVCGFLLLTIDKAPWLSDWTIAFKRTVLVALPASLSAAVADMIK
jgi:uncharacterized membrane protein